MNVLRSLLLVVAVSICHAICARDLYISLGGDDRNPGTLEQPLASLYGARDLIRHLRAVEKLDEEVRVIIGEGMYYMPEPLELTDQDCGPGDAMVTFMASNKEAPPVFIGGLQVRGWVKISDNLWKTSIPEVRHFGFYFEQLYINGKRGVRAKSPNNGFYFLKAVDELIAEQGSGRVPPMAVQKLKVFAAAAADINSFTKEDFDDALIVLYHKWDNTRKRITNYEQDSAIIFTTGTGMKPWNRLDHKTRFTIDNFRAGIDTCGEWFLERNGDLYYMPREGEDMNNIQVFAPVADRFLVLKGNPAPGEKVENIRFENLRFEVAGYRTPVWGNEAAQAASPIEAAIMIDYAEKIDFVGCEISQTGTNGIWFRKSCNDCSVTRCYIHDLGAGGVKIGEIMIPEDDANLTKRITIDNNIIRSGGYVFPCAVGITIFQASDNAVTHNEIANFRYSGVSVGWVWGYTHSPSKRNAIDYNHIHHLGWGDLCDMGGVYCLGQSEGTSVSNNVIHHVYSYDYGGWGLYTDEGSTGILMENNLVYACKNSGFHQHYGRGNTIHNNIFAGNIRAQLQATRVEDHLSFNFTNNIVWFSSGDLLSSRWGLININSDWNCYWDTRTRDVRFGKLSFEEWKASGKDRHSIIADPGFAKPENFDYRIKNKAVLKKIDFKSFDYTQAGVYGSKDWIELAKSDPVMVDDFDEIVERHESRTQ